MVIAARRSKGWGGGNSSTSDSCLRKSSADVRKGSGSSIHKPTGPSSNASARDRNPANRGNTRARGPRPVPGSLPTVAGNAHVLLDFNTIPSPGMGGEGSWGSIAIKQTSKMCCRNQTTQEKKTLQIRGHYPEMGALYPVSFG